MSKNDKEKSQAELYARDLAQVYIQEKKHRSELEIKNQSLELANNQLLLEKAQLKAYADDFSTVYNQLQESYSRLEQANYETIYRLSLAAEFRDGDTAGHLSRISEYTAVIARNMGMDDEKVTNLKHASALHDIGKLGVSDQVLFKPGKYTDDEFEEMKKHTYIGHLILRNSESELLQLGEIIAYTHHEKWNGSGYPRGLKQGEIPLEGRIVAIADVFDALTMKRVYKPAFTRDKVMEIMSEGRGHHFDPEIFDVFMSNINEIETLSETFKVSDRD